MSYKLSEKGVPRFDKCDSCKTNSSVSMCGTISIFPKSKLVMLFNRVNSPYEKELE